MAIKLTTNWQLVAEGTSQVTSNTTGYTRLYMKYAPVNSTQDRIYYEIRQYAYNPYGRYLAWEWTGNYNWSIKSGSTTRASGSHTQTPAIYSTDTEPENTINNSNYETLRVGNTDGNGDKYYTVSRNSNGTYSDTITFSAPVFKTIVTVKDIAIELPPYYTLTVNGNLDGNISADTSSHGTFTISLNGGAHSSRITGYSNKVLEGTTWTIGGPYPNLGKTYTGYSAGDKSGTVRGNTTVTIKFSSTKYYITYSLDGGTNGSGNPSSFFYGNTITLTNPTKTGYTFTGWTTSGGTLSGSTLTPPASDITLTANWSINTYTNTIHHYAAGFTKGEGNSGANRQFVFLGDTSFKATYGSTITYDSSKFTTIPNGYTWSAMGSGSFNSSWVGYPLGQQFSQPAKNTAMQFDYHPIPYTITYNLDGGTNHSSNPTSYNVLYGVTFAEPTKAGYAFTGWTIDGVSVTGINPGATANFADSTALYAGLRTRTTGNKTVVAHWEKKPVGGKIPVKVNGEWKTGIPHVKQSGEWKKGKKVYVKKEGIWVLSK